MKLMDRGADTNIWLFQEEYGYGRLISLLGLIKKKGYMDIYELIESRSGKYITDYNAKFEYNKC
jgi:hypothetical protein